MTLGELIKACNQRLEDKFAEARKLVVLEKKEQPG